eukprot:92873-Amphidinium_carterae.1
MEVSGLGPSTLVGSKLPTSLLFEVPFSWHKLWQTTSQSSLSLFLCALRVSSREEIHSCLAGPFESALEQGGD